MAKLVATALMVSGATACGSNASPLHASSRPVTGATRSVPARHFSHSPVGATERVRAAGTTLSVTVNHVIDPLTRSGAAVQPGSRAVGVVIRIQNHGPGVYDSSATGDVSIVPSAGTSTPVFAAHGVCQTPLRDFDNYITAGEVRHGCVVFSLDAGARVLAVRFSPHGRAAGRATWVASR